ncbi:hypothetical protein TWF102_008313 [Orbilia oligospora]|uniref:Extracellular membrane protein CFEM domain-containing protein n=1 Tax=Orbilia oligospora TaxID=2813651 RepID=A0A7C8NA71_ORBOL|nr:hypothetical protein TWF706_001292 [Orbilia oligospora]KAF3092815.1 hypothetical protein TWF102_008313 [Orbilia oligospora]KAF3093691.1 hypothetical protein TWF103_010760 [Orbilia oligospora]KAF3144336.1 hypothetical protein TWF594_004859 [Orbilia oligospora]
MYLTSITTLCSCLLATLATAFPHYRRQDTSNSTVEAPAIGISMGCTIMANACKFYIQSPQCTQEWVLDVHRCIPEACISLREMAMRPCQDEPEEPELEGRKLSYSF